jgi:hypothetical protein
VITASTSEIEEIRRQMAAIRKELHEDVRGVVESAESVTDWRRYLRMYPWLSVGAALAVGYLIVPRRHAQVPPDVTTQLRELVTESQAKETERPSWLGSVFGVLAPVVVRAAQGYAAHYLEQWIAQQQHVMAARSKFGHAGMSSGGPGRPEGGAQR